MMLLTKDKPKVVITYIEAGMGHAMSATAVSEALHLNYGEQLTIVDAKICHLSDNQTLVKFEKNLVRSTKAYSKGRLAASLQYGLLRILGGRLARWCLYNLVWGRPKRAMIKEFRRLDPDVIIATHFAVADFAATYRDRYKPTCKVITYNPDYNTLAFWGHRDDLFIVNNAVAYRHCLERKFPMARVREVPFVIRQCLKDCHLTKAEARSKHGLPADKFTICLVDGAYGAAKLKTYTDELLKIDRPVTLLVGACKNTALYEHYQQLVGRVPAQITLVPLAFRMDIYEFYRAADVVITKTGASICLDCLCMNTPMLVNYCAQPIEEFNRDLFLNEYQIGEWLPDAVACRERIEQFIDNPALLTPYVEHTQRFDKHNDGGRQVADLIFAKVIEPVVQ